MAADRRLPMYLDPTTGQLRQLGSRPSDPRLVAALPVYRGEILPESELEAYHAHPAEIKVRDQGQQGSCNGYATAAAGEGVRFVQGFEHVPLSGSYVYSILCRGRDAGSNILQAYKLAGDRGLAPDALVRAGTLNPNSLTAEAHAAAGRFRLEFGAAYQSWRQVVSAVMLREVLNLSVCVLNRFSFLDDEDVAGVDRGVGNHAVCVGLGLRHSSRWGWMVLCRNSWGTRWGRLGFCWLAEAHIEAGSYFECFGVKGVVADPLDPDRIPSIGSSVLASLPRRTTWTPASSAA